jgi:predicted glycoside hydrolase/deacetylase ChbG (UPF0249 family)
MPKYLIVNADDFGQSPGTNRGIIEAHERGIVTSASLMVRWDAAPEAADYCRARPGFSAGLHFEVGEWAFRNQEWEPLYEVVPPDNPDEVRKEAYRQLDMFRQLVGRDPEHIDSHQHVHLREPARSVLREIAASLAVPLRHESGFRYCGAFYGQTTEGESLPELIRPEALIRILRELPEGATELCCHPGRGSDLQTMYGREREQEVESLCDPAVRAALAGCGIELRSFGKIV